MSKCTNDRGGGSSFVSSGTGPPWGDTDGWPFTTKNRPWPSACCTSVSVKQRGGEGSNSHLCCLVYLHGGWKRSNLLMRTVPVYYNLGLYSFNHNNNGDVTAVWLNDTFIVLFCFLIQIRLTNLVTCFQPVWSCRVSWSSRLFCDVAVTLLLSLIGMPAKNMFPPVLSDQEKSFPGLQKLTMTTCLLVTGLWKAFWIFPLNHICHALMEATVIFIWIISILWLWCNTVVIQPQPWH